MPEPEFGPADLVPGDAVAVVLRSVVALVDADVRSDVVTSLVEWSDESLDDLLMRWASAGVDALPAFALVDLGGRDARVVVRGAVSVTVRSGEAEEVVDGAGSPTWIDRIVDGDDYELAMHGVTVESAGYRVPPGVFPAGAVSASVVGRDRPSPDAPVIVEEPVPVVAADGDSDLGPALDPRVGLTLVDPYTDVFVEPEPAASEPAPPQPATSQPAAPPAAAPQPAAPQPAASPPAAPLPGPPAGGEIIGSVPLIEAVPGLGGSSGNDYDQLFGATQFRRVEDAAVRPDDEEAAAVAEVGVSPFAAEAGAADRDGRTMAWSQVQALQGTPASGTGTGTGAAPVDPAGTPIVHATRCGNGHLNPTQASVCRACGAPIPDQPHVSVPRPVLGRFVFSSGEVVDVARPMLIGRAPKLGGVVSGQPPELVTVPSPDRGVSGTHVETRLEGWQVLVVDRNSTNGTVIQLPGRPPQRLRSGEPFPITPGTTVVMADEVQFVYEAAE